MKTWRTFLLTALVAQGNPMHAANISAALSDALHTAAATIENYIPHTQTSELVLLGVVPIICAVGGTIYRCRRAGTITELLTLQHLLWDHGPREPIETLLKKGVRCVHPLHIIWGSNLPEAVITERMRLLLDYGANVDERNTCGILLLCRVASASHQQTEPAKLLLERGADPKARCRCCGQTPLHIAAKKGNLGVARLLMPRLVAADVNALDTQGYTPLMLAVSEKLGTHTNTDLIQELLNHGALVNVRDKAGTSVLTHSAFNSNWGALQHLLDHARGALPDNDLDDAIQRTHQELEKPSTVPVEINIGRLTRNSCLKLLNREYARRAHASLGGLPAQEHAALNAKMALWEKAEIKALQELIHPATARIVADYIAGPAPTSAHAAAHKEDEEHETPDTEDKAWREMLAPPTQARTRSHLVASDQGVGLGLDQAPFVAGPGVSGNV